MKQFLALLVFFFGNVAFGQVAGKVEDATIMPGRSGFTNYIKNSSAINSSSDGTNQIGDALLVRQTGTKFEGKASFNCDTITVNDACEHLTIPIHAEDQVGDCRAGMHYVGDASLYNFQVLDGSNNLLNEIELTNATVPTEVKLPVYCGADRKIRVTQKTAGAGNFNYGILRYGKSETYSLLSDIAPTVTKYTSGSGTYTPPEGVTRIHVRIVGGGGGGQGSGTTTPGNGTPGGNTTFGGLTASGGAGGGPFQGGVGGAVAASGVTPNAAVKGSDGGSFIVKGSGIDTGAASGGTSFFGGAGGGVVGLSAGRSAATNSGSGGGGAGMSSATNGIIGAGGGAGGYIDAFFEGPFTSFSYGVGSAGVGGSATTSGAAGGNGAAGYIEITEYYDSVSVNVVSPDETADLLGTYFFVTNSICPANSAEANGQTLTGTQWTRLIAYNGTAVMKDMQAVSPRGTGTQSINGRTKTGPAVGVLQEDQMQGHIHGINQSSSNVYAGGLSPQTLASATSLVGTSTTAIGGPLTDGTNGTPRTGTETRGNSIGVKWCQWGVSQNAPLIPTPEASTTGSGEENYILNGTAEGGTTGFVAYADAAGTSPVDGTGGSPTFLVQQTTVDPLDGDASFLLTKAATNSQGQGAAIDFEIPNSQRAKVLSIRSNYIVKSGTFTAGATASGSDNEVWVYDVTNARLIQPSSIKFFSNSTTTSDQFQAEFQSSADSNNYRLIFHVATTNASAWAIALDEIKVTPSKYVYGTPITDWQSYTPVGSHTTNTTYTGWKRRVGDTAEYRVQVSYTGQPNNNSLNVTIPDGSPDLTKVSSIAPIGNGMASDAGTGNYPVNVYFNGTLAIPYVPSGTTTDITDNRINSIFSVWPGIGTGPAIANGDNIRFSFSIPITGWSSSVQMSDNASTRVVSEGMGTSTATSIATGTTATVALNTVLHSSHGTSNTTLNRITIPTAGYYRVSGMVTMGGGATSGRVSSRILKNGTIVQVMQGNGNISGNGSAVAVWEGYAIAGDYFQLSASHDIGSTRTIETNFAATNLFVSSIQGPSSIAATESIIEIWRDAGQTYSASGVQSALTWSIKDVSTHGAFNGTTGVFTAPAAGTYEFKIGVAAYGTGTVSFADLLLDGPGSNDAVVRTTGSIISSNNLHTTHLSKTLPLLAGQTVTLGKNATYSTGTFQIFSTSIWNNLSIIRIGL